MASLALVFGAMSVGACECDGARDPIVPVTTDVGVRDVEADLGTDAVGPEDVALDVPGADVQNDARSDSSLPDAPGVDFPPDAGPTPVADTCVDPALACIARMGAPLSCSTRPDGLVEQVAYEGGFTTEITRAADGPSLFQIFEGGVLCAEGAYPVANLDNEVDGDQTWSFNLPTGPMKVQASGEVALIECPSGSTFVSRLTEVAPYLPNLPELDDPLCAVVDSVACRNDLECDALDCCPVLGGSRCLAAAACPDTGLGTLDGCLAPLLGCFGARTPALECLLAADGVATMAYVDETQTASFEVTGGVWSVSAEKDGAACYTVELDGTPGAWTQYRFTDPAGTATITATVTGSSAQVECADGETSSIPVSEFEAFVPVVRAPNACTPSCEDDGECGAGLCCPSSVEGLSQCANVSSCSDLTDPVFNSCLWTTLECFGRDNVAGACQVADWTHTRATKVSYPDDAEAVFYEAAGHDRLRVNSPSFHTCFDLEEVPGGYEMIGDLEAPYTIAVDGDSAVVTCPDGGEDVIPTATLLAFFPTRPDDASCDPWPRTEACQSDDECTGVLEVCCDLGWYTDCRTANVCTEPVPTCEGDDTCSDGQICCPQDLARVCDYRVCGDPLCCQAVTANVCADPGACQ